jgi:hypothetical protein
MPISKLLLPLRMSMSLRQCILISNLVQEISRLRSVASEGASAAILIGTLCSPPFALADPCSSEIFQPLSPSTPAMSTTPKKPSNLADKTKSALASAWIDPSGAVHLLKALGILTSSSAAYAVNQRVFLELKRASPGNASLFQAAMGDFDQYGQPTIQGLPDLLDILAKASTEPSDEKNTKYRIALAACTQDLVDDLFNDPSGDGVLALARINDSFVRKNKYVALYQLLDAVWKKKNDVQYLEKLRDAFSLNADDLANQVSLKISPAK